MRIYLFLIGSVALVAASCASDEVKPKLRKEKFAQVLAELAIQEGKYSKTYDLDSNASKILAWNSDSILTRYKVNKADFKQTVGYYVAHKSEFIEVYKIAIDTVLARRDTLLNTK